MFVSVLYINLWLLFGIALHIVFALFQSFKDERATTIPIVITINREIKKRNKDIIPKIKQRILTVITLQGAIKKSLIFYRNDEKKTQFGRTKIF